MLNFTIKTPTEVVFGRDIEDGIGERIKEYGAHRVLVHFGGASARSSGLLDRVERSLFDAGLREDIQNRLDELQRRFDERAACLSRTRKSLLRGNPTARSAQYDVVLQKLKKHLDSLEKH